MTTTLKTYKRLMNEAKQNDKSVTADFDRELDITAYLKKDPKIKAHGGKDNLYFDGGALVFGSKTVQTDLISDDGWDVDITMADLKNMILKMPKIVVTPSKGSPRKAGKQTVGKFVVSIPTQVGGVHGAGAQDLENPRVVIDASPEDSVEIKKLHDKKGGVEIRVMKRAKGNKVYVDFKKGADVSVFLDTLEKIK